MKARQSMICTLQEEAARNGEGKTHSSENVSATCIGSLMPVHRIHIHIRIADPNAVVRMTRCQVQLSVLLGKGSDKHAPVDSMSR